MSTTVSIFCDDIIADARIWEYSRVPGVEVMVLSIKTDTGDDLTIHFKDEYKFKEFCKKHNFQLEDKRNESKH